MAHPLWKSTLPVIATLQTPHVSPHRKSELLDNPSQCGGPGEHSQKSLPGPDGSWFCLSCDEVFMVCGCLYHWRIPPALAGRSWDSRGLSYQDSPRDRGQPCTIWSGSRCSTRDSSSNHSFLYSGSKRPGRTEGHIISNSYKGGSLNAHHTFILGIQIFLLSRLQRIKY